MICKECDTVKELEEFPVYKRVDGKTYRRKKCRSCFNAGVMDWQTNNPDAKWITYLRRNYNLSFDEYRELMSRGCEICGVMEGLCIDHDHSCCPTKTKTCGKCIRGVLCQRHNLAEGLLNSNPEEAIALAGYMLKNQKEVQVQS